MELTTFGLIAFLSGGLMLLMAVPMIFASEWFRKELMSTVKEKPGLAGMQLYSMIVFVFGLWVLSVECRLMSGMGWYIVVPILGYIYALKGIFGFLAPGWVEHQAERMYGKGPGIAAAGVLALAMGILLLWLAFSVF
jgi:hypothetical protein